MIEKDNIQELFSKAFENHASAVKPELWTGVQAKMAAAGMVGGTAAVKGISALTKWIIGTAAVTTIGVTTYLIVDNNTPAEKPADSNTTIATPSSSETPTDETKTVAFDQKNGNAVQNSKGMVVPSYVNPADGPVNIYTMPVIVNHEPDYNVPVFDSKQNVASAGNNNSSANTTEQAGTPESSSPISKAPVNTKETTVREPESNNVEASANSVKAAKVEVPNVFSPNFDRTNDYFELISEENVSKVEITIYDPNGKKVFVSNEKDFRWDGNSMSGEACAQGIYSYQMVYFDLNGKANLKGDYIYLQR